MKRLSKKGFVILFGSVLGVALIVWVVLIFGIFRKDKNKKVPEWVESGKAQTYELPEVPEGYKLTFFQVAEYDVSKNGKVVLRMKNVFDDDDNQTATLYYDESGKYAGETRYSKNNDGSETAVTYDEKKKVVKEAVSWYDSNRNLVEYTEQEENEDGDLEFSERKTYEYDADGNKIRETNYNADGSLRDYTVFDSEGRTLEERLWTGDVCYNKYDEKGNLLEKKRVWEEDGELQEYVQEEYQYAPDGRLLEIRSYGERTKYEYDGNGKMVKEIVYYDNGNVRKLTEYNEKELPVRIISYDYGDDPVTWTQTCEYDGNGNEIKRVTYADDKLISWYEMEYDEIGAKYGRYTRVVSKDEDGKILDYTEMKYVESGDNVPVRVMQMNYDGDSTIVEYGYEIELDEYGNEVRYKRYEKGELVSQTVFEYKAFVEPIRKK